MKPDQIIHNQSFLSGKGEMKTLIREKNWSLTPLGSTEKWPQSLRTTLSIVLNSKFPMFLFWGSKLTCFYNDAYRPSLGKDGKHPMILGMDAEEAWPEIWNIIKPFIDQVLNGGEATWSENQLIPIFRNGKLEDVYWTFSYSPIHNESGKVAGVLVTCSETTEKINTLKKIEESEERFRTMAECTNILIALGDETSNATYFNKAWVDLTGRTEEELLKFGWADLIHPDDREKYVNIYLSAFEKRIPFEGEFRVLNKEGKYRWLLAKGPPRFRCDGSFAGYISSCIDIHDQVIYRKKLKEDEERLNVIINASGLGTWDLNLITKEVNYSSRYLEILGYDGMVELTHQQIKSHLHPDDLHIRNKAFEDAFVTGVLHYEARVIWNDKSIHWIEGKAKVFYDDDNKPIKLIGTVQDITEEKNHREILQKNEQKFRLLADSMPQHIWTSDIEGNLNYYNQSVFNYSGLTLEQITKDGWIQIVHPDDREENIKRWTHSVTTGEDFLIEHRFRKHTGEYRWQLSRAIPQRDAQGNIQMWVGTSTDIQNQKTFTSELEQEVQERTRQLEQKNKELQNMNTELQSFAYVSSHDLQEPLRKIQTFASRIIEKENQNLSDPGKDYFKRIQESAERMQTLIQDLLLYSRTSKADRVFINSNLKTLFNEVIKELKEIINEKKAIIEIEETCNASIIPFQFTQMLHNLINNALKFSKPEEIPHIKLKSEIVHPNQTSLNFLSSNLVYCHISVSDNGIGIDAQYKDRIFEVFQRLHAKNEYPGTGIGLAIVKKIVENHNGIINVVSELNKGATFNIYIPS